MTLEYLHEGSPDCPLIRLFAFTPLEATKLRTLFVSLSDGSCDEIKLDGLPFVEARRDVSLRLRRAEKDTGIRNVGSTTFDCDLTQEAWAEMADKTEPFCTLAEAGTYQWLNEDGNVSLLLSPSECW